MAVLPPYHLCYSFQNLLFPTLYIPLFPSFAGIQQTSEENLGEQRKYSTKLVLEEIAGASSYKDSQTSATSGAKRSLEFPEDLPADTHAKHPTKAPEEFAKEPAKLYGPPANIKDSPTKKAKAKED
nr:uncharacterized protein LOC113715494 [Coffea arabica]